MQAQGRIGRYELHSLLGKGGAGEVWSATLHGPRGFERPVAVKRLLHAGGDRDALIREARLGARLAHPNVVAVHDLVALEDGWMVVMEQVQGPSAGQLLKRSVLPPWAVLEIGLQVCTALRAIHAAGLVHRDIKPANLLVDRSGLVKVADLGLTQLVGTTSAPGGTPGFMAPEQVHGSPEARSDLFSLGATLLALATRLRPFGAGAEAVVAVGRADQVLARSGALVRLEEVLPGLAPLVRELLRADPRRRPASALEVAEALRPLAEREGRASLAALVVDDPAPAWTDPVEHSLDSEASTLLTLPGNLRPPPDDFIGRSAEVTELTARLRSAGGLVTLTGPGGVGKTRLALQLASALAPKMQGGWFCDCTGATTLEGLLHLVGRTLGVVLGDAPAAQLGSALQVRGDCVVVLDNLEQVVGPARGAVEAWLPEAPQTRFVATSRVPLDVRGEQVHRIEPLSDDDAVDLFETRAVRTPSRSHAAAVRQLVRHLDCLPLAIELAAARTRVLDAPSLLERLDERFKLLADPRGRGPARRHSLVASIDASWELLAPWERAALAQLSVFRGGFSLSAAEAVLDLGAHDAAPWVVDVLDALVAQSLVTVRGRRFDLLVSIAAYADARLTDVERAAAVARHGSYLAHLAGSAGPTMWSGVPRRDLPELSADLDNLVAASERAVERGDREVAVPCTLAVLELVHAYGPAMLGEELLASVLADASDAERAPLLVARARRHRARGDHERVLRDARAASKIAASPGVLADAQAMVAWGENAAGRPDAATTLMREALAGAEGRGPGAGALHLTLAAVLRDQGDYAGSVEHAMAGRDAARISGDLHQEARAVRSMAAVAHYLGDWPTARIHLDEFLRLEARTGTIARNGHARALRGFVLLAGGDLEGCLHELRASQALIEAQGNAMEAAHGRTNLGGILALHGELDRALRLVGDGLAFFEGADLRSHVPWARGALGQVHMYRGELDLAEPMLRDGALGCARMGQRLEASQYWLSLGELCQRAGRHDETVEAASQAASLAVSPETLAATSTLAAWAHRSLGQHEQARRCWQESRANRRGFAPSEIPMLCLDAVMHHDAGDAAAAGLALGAARALVTRMGPGPRSPLHYRLREAERVLAGH